MDITKTRLMLLVLVVAMLTFAFIVVPVSADTPINAMTDRCNCGCDSNTIDVQSSIPSCCSISDRSFCDCILSGVPDNEAILPSRTTLNLDVNNGQYVQGVSTEVDEVLKQPLEQKSSQLLPAYLCSEYHCRNSLNSEAPLLN
jgi:hypothetical protein